MALAGISGCNSDYHLRSIFPMADEIKVFPESGSI